MPFGTLLTQPGQYQYDGPGGRKILMGKGTSIRVIKVEGLLDTTVTRRTVNDKQGAHGGYASSAPFMSTRNITVEMVISIPGKAAEAEQLLDEVQAVFSPHGDHVEEGVFSWWRRGKQPRMCFALLNRSAFPADFATSTGKISGFLELEALDPRVYSIEEAILQVGLPLIESGRIYPRTYPVVYPEASGGGHIVVENIGNLSSPPILRVYGPVTDPALLNSTSGREIKLTGSVGASDFIEIDVESGSIRLNGLEARRTMLNPVSRWWELEPGANDIRFLARTNEVGSRLEIYARSAWNSG